MREPVAEPHSSPAHTSDASPEESAVDESAGASAAPDELDGEDARRLVGIMYSERVWVVPYAVKVAFFWISVSMIVGLGTFETAKRWRFRELLVDSIVEPTSIGDVPASSFTLPEGEGGKPLSLDQFKGQWVLVNFWATWCPPCRDEMPSLEMLNRRFQDRMTLLAVSVDDDWSEVKRFFGDTAPSFRVLWDRDKATALTYSTRKFPETYLVAPDGRIVAKFVGPRDWYNQATIQYFDEVLSGRRKPVS